MGNATPGKGATGEPDRPRVAWYGAPFAGALRGGAPTSHAGSDALIDDRPPVTPRRSRTIWILLIGAFLTLAVPAFAAAVNAVTRQMESVRRLETEIAGIEARYGQASAAYSAASARLAEVRGRIQENTEALARAREQFARQRGLLAMRLSAVYRQPQPSGLQVLLRSGSLSEAISRMDFMDRVQRQDADIIEEIAASRERMRTARVQLIADQKVAKVEAKQTRARLGEVRSVRAARRGVLLSARRQLTVMIAAAQRQADARRLASLRAAQRTVVQRVGSPVPEAPPAPTSAAGGGATPDKLRQIALCESGGNPSAVSPSGLYRGKYQFDPQTWKSLGGAGNDPAAASEAEQDRVAALLYSQRGSAPWPVCGR